MADPLAHALPGPYLTELPAPAEKKFLSWVEENKIPFDPEEKNSDYDMRGFYKALLSGDPRATTAVDPYDKRIHFPDIWKTPYHETFSNESIYAKPTAPSWSRDGKLISNDGTVLFDAAAPALQ